MSDGEIITDSRRNPPEVARLWQTHIRGSDPTAFDRLFTLLAEPLFRQVRRKCPNSPESDIEDAVAIALGYIATHPAKYDPAKSSLFYFLAFIAERRVADMWRRQNRFVALELSDANSTEERDIPDPNAETEREALRNLIYRGRDPRDDLPLHLASWLETVLPDEKDRALFLWTLEGRAQVTEFAALFALTDQPLEVQQSEMKRNRDRIQKRVSRAKAGLEALLREDNDGNRR